MPKLDRNEEKVLKYLQEHKTPVHPDTLAKRYIWSSSKTTGVLHSLVEMGLSEVILVGKKKFYKLKPGS